MKTLLTILLCLLGWTIQAEELPQPLSPRQLVHDYTRLFTAKQQATLEQHLRRFHDTTSTQIAVAVVPTLQGMSANSYAQQLFLLFRNTKVNARRNS